MKFLSLAVSFLLLIIGCKSNINSPAESVKYPSGLNNQWEYNTVFRTIQYDSHGNLADSSNQIIGNTIVKIIGVNQSLGSISNLILFECYETDTPTLIEKDWYLNADSGFYCIAYSSAGAAEPVNPKNGLRLNYLSGLWPKHATLMPAFDYADNKGLDDSVLYYYSPRVIVTYPLDIGNRWVELLAPFNRERYVTNMEDVQVNNETYKCYAVEADMASSHFKMIDDINLAYGLIRRTIISDSLPSTDSGGGTNGMFEKVISVSTLVRKNF